MEFDAVLFTGAVSIQQSPADIISTDDFKMSASGLFFRKSEGVVSLAIPHANGMTIVSLPTA